MFHKLTAHAPLFASVQLCLGSFFLLSRDFLGHFGTFTFRHWSFLLLNLNEARAKETIAAYLKGLREGTPEEQADGEFVSR
jgi:hypothetical protein